jgi:hypothetical protein
VVEVLKTYQIFLHQITPEAVIRMEIFVWAMRSQGLEPSARCFCSMHELSYETKPSGKEQYHNNFGCYSFVARSGSSYPVPTFRKRWLGAWMEEWFYVKNDLKAREDIKEIIMRPIWSRFGLRKLKVEIDEAAKASRRAFSTVCSYIGTRDLVQEHVAYMIWPLIDSWEMPKETITNPSEGGLVRLKYTFKFGDQFVEPDDDWLKCVENTSDELLGAYSNSEDNTLSAAFGSRKKKRLNRVFDAIGFVYLDYRYPSRGQKRKGPTSGKVAALAAPSEPALKRKKLKVLTHRPRYIEPAIVPEFGEETSAVTEAQETAPPTQEIEEPAVMPKAPSSKLIETRVNEDKAEKSKTEEATKMPEILCPSAEATVPKAEKSSAITPRKKRMVNVLDILETTDSKRPSSIKKVVESAKAQAEADTRQMKGKTATIEARAEAEPTVLVGTKLSTAEQGAEEVPPNTDIAFEINMAKEAESLAPEAPSEYPDYIIRHASGKQLSEEEILKLNIIPEN